MSKVWSFGLYRSSACVGGLFFCGVVAIMFLISSGNIANLLAFLALFIFFRFIAVLGCPSIPSFVGVAAPDMLSYRKLSESSLGVCECHHCMDISRPASTGSTSSKKLKRVRFAVQLEEVICHGAAHDSALVTSDD